MYETPQANPFLVIFWILYLAVLIASNWKIFVKAGKPGWAILVPIYNVIVFLQMIKKPLWWIILFFIPFVNLVILIMSMLAFVKVFGKPAWHIIPALLIGFIYYPYIAFSKTKYTG